MHARSCLNPKYRGSALLLSVILVLMFSALAVSLATLSGNSVQLASTQHKVNTALYAAQSGLECAKYIVSTADLGETNVNYVTDAQANQAWINLCHHVQVLALDGKAVPSPRRFSDGPVSGDELVTPAMDFGGTQVKFVLRFYRFDTDPRTIKMQAKGANSDVTRRIGINMALTKDRDVLTYAIASRGRMWLTGETTIHGDLFSTWDRPEIAPYNMSNDSIVEGTISTVLARDDIAPQNYQLETLDVNGCPIDINGDLLTDNYSDRYYGAGDEVQAYHEGIKYNQPYQGMPGMDISDYNTDGYNAGLAELPACDSDQRQIEYFPHASGDYTAPRDGTPNRTSNRQLDRHVYENQTFSNVRLPDNRNALFKNCTFEDVLYIDCYKSGSTGYNNVRFDDCTFNGIVVTDAPQTFKWQNNCLYFTGAATFNNQSAVKEATILAPHFNVNLGNTNPQQADNNVLTGAIVGGIVDVRGNAQIDGTIISMCDTTRWSSGYVTNIGATLNDGGSETTELGDIGVIGITPEPDMMLPSGIMSPIVIKPDQRTYSEGV